MTNTITPSTTERFLAMARDAILDNADLKPDELTHLRNVKLTYGAGNGSYRGVTFFGAWQTIDAPDEHGRTDFIEIAASAQESWVQLAGTLLHEYAHSLAGIDAGHSVAWKETCKRLGFQIRPEAAGQRYYLAIFRPQLRMALVEIARQLRDGSPLFRMVGGMGLVTGSSPRPCRAGQGTRGGSSRGKGSGSRLRLWECGCERPVKVRVASDAFDATCNVCGQVFARR